MLKTEYLITIDKKNNVAIDMYSFNNLLMSNPNIKINKNAITYFSQKYKYTIQYNNINNTSYICYHITIECTIEDFSFNNANLQLYQNLLRDIRFILFKCSTDIEILWDDISFNCSQKAYPLIYKIENLMRKLLTKFMLINVGSKWEKENIPSKISKSKNKEKDINLGNGLLYQLDFIELSTFLFDTYSLNNNLNELKKKVEKKEDIPFSLMNDFIARSNWERYFSKIVLVENEHLKKKWNELYILRCKIAHNNMFTISDYKNVESIVADLKPILEKALDKLDSIKIADDVKESVSESFARTTNEQVGSLILAYNKLDKEIHNFFINVLPENKISDTRMPLLSSKLLYQLLKNGLIDDTVYNKLKLITYKRNKIVHQDSHIPDNEIYQMLNLINEYTSYFQKKNLEFNEKEIDDNEIK